MSLNIGDSIIVKSGVSDPDLNTTVEGWQGRVSDIQDNNIVCIEWDSITLKEMPASIIIKCEQEGLAWEQMCLYESEVSLTTPRDTHSDIESIIEEIQKKYEWVYLGEDGERIQEVLSGVLSDDIWDSYKAWDKYLNRNLNFPLHAVVAEFQDRSILQEGDNVTILGINETVEMHGILVDIEHSNENYVYPLSDLEVKDKYTSNYQPIKDYVVWFANK